MTAGFSLRGLLVALGVVALGLPAAFAGLYGVIAQLDTVNTLVAKVREAQLGVAELRRLQSDEESGIRGYAQTRDPAYREIYEDAVREFPVQCNVVENRLRLGPEGSRAAAALQDARARNARWRVRVAEPALAHGRLPVDDRAGRADLTEFRNDTDRISAVLIDDYHRLINARAVPIAQATQIGVGALAVVALQVIAYAFLVGRLRGELVRERRVVAVLQRAFTSEILNDERLDVAASYVSATRGAKVGGDVYDIFPLDADRTFIVIADVSGKGVEAAVDSTFVKYSLRAFASEYASIATIVSKFNTLYDRAQRAPEAFVVLFAGILDHRSAHFTYVNAGHEAAYVRRRASVEQLAPTGPIIGIDASAAFGYATTPIASDELLFLSTDGLTEARAPSGEFLTGDRLEVWLREADASTAKQVVDDITRRLRRFTRDRSADDLAIMAVRPRAGGG